MSGGRGSLVIYRASRYLVLVRIRLRWFIRSLNYMRQGTYFGEAHLIKLTDSQIYFHPAIPPGISPIKSNRHGS